MKSLTFIWLTLEVTSPTLFYDYGRESGGYSDKGDYKNAIKWLKSNSDSGKSLVIFLHPKCPCSRSSVEEYSNIISLNKNIKPIVVFSIAKGLNDFESDIDELKEILERKSKNNYAYYMDKNLQTASKFGALTSGYTLYFENSELKFRGGLTPVRAHIGKTLAHDFIGSKENKFLETSVYGCEISNKECLNNNGEDDVQR